MEPKLIIRSPDGKEQAFALDDKTDICHIGRADENDIHILESVVSRHHCQIQKTPQGYQLTDLKSRAGTYVNNIKVGQCLLTHNDKIKISDTVITFVLPDQVPVSRAIGEKRFPKLAKKPPRKRFIIIKRSSSLVIPVTIVILVVLIIGLVFFNYLPKEHSKPAKTKLTPSVEAPSIEQEAQEQLDLVRFKERLLADDSAAVKQLYTELLTKYEDTNIASTVHTRIRHCDELILKKYREDYYSTADKTAGYLKDKNYLGARAEWQKFLEKYSGTDSEWVEKARVDLSVVTQLMDNHFKDSTLNKDDIKQIAKDVQELLKPADELWQEAKACYDRALELRENPTAKNKELLKGKNLLYEAYQGYDEIRHEFPQQKYAWLDQKKKEILELMRVFRSARVRETKEEDQESYKPEPSTKELDEDKGVPFIKESEKATAKEKEWICPRCHGTCSVECDACSGTGYKMVKCPSCKGTGVCQRCKGYGKYTIRGEHPRRMHICTSCKGTGKCSRCGGTGIIRGWKCSKCKGTGRLKCPDCGGKGTVAPRLAQIQPKGLKDKQICKRDIRKKRLSLNGGSAKTESAVLAGLWWLARHQNPDGSWGAGSFQNQCKGTECSGCGSSFFNIGLTGLASLAFTGATYTPASKDVYGGIRFGDVVRKAVLYLKNIQRDDGAFGSPGTGKFMYNQAIATYALADLVALMQDKGEVIGSVPFRGHVLKGINFILRSQNPGKAWRYRPRCGDNDASVTSWCAMALKAAEEGVLYVPETVWTGVKRHLDDVTHENGMVGYIQKGGVAIFGREAKAFQSGTLYTPPSLTAAGIMMRIFMGENRNSETIKKGARLLLKNLPAWDTSKRGKIDYYYWFYGSYALHQYDGPKGPCWNYWNKAMKAILLNVQKTRDDGCASGSWDPIDRWSEEAGRVYATAISVLTLEVYYRLKLRK